MLDGGRRFDVVITDLEMPGMDGFELASAVRGNPRTAEVPIIGLSSLVSAEAIERGKRVGLHDYVAKFDRRGPDRGAQGADRRSEPRGVNGMSDERSDENVVEYVTATIGGQLFGLPISRVQDVFMPERLTRVPLAAPEIAGPAQPARPHRHGRRHAPPARFRGAATRRRSARWRSASSTKANPMVC